MLKFDVHDGTTAPVGSRPLLEGLRAQVGFVPNLAGAMANSPALLGAFLGAREAFQSASLSPAQREIIALVVAVDSEAAYPIAAHSTFAIGAGASHADVGAIRRGERPEGVCEAILVETVRKMLRSSGRLEHEDATRFIEAGFGPAQLLEVAAGIGMTQLAAMAANLTDPTIDPAFAAAAG
jgi:alkylhydroperoxidase family enzyme